MIIAETSQSSLFKMYLTLTYNLLEYLWPNLKIDDHFYPSRRIRSDIPTALKKRRLVTPLIRDQYNVEVFGASARLINTGCMNRTYDDWPHASHMSRTQFTATVNIECECYHPIFITIGRANSHIACF